MDISESNKNKKSKIHYSSSATGFHIVSKTQIYLVLKEKMFSLEPLKKTITREQTSVIRKHSNNNRIPTIPELRANRKGKSSASSRDAYLLNGVDRSTMPAYPCADDDEIIVETTQTPILRCRSSNVRVYAILNDVKLPGARRSRDSVDFSPKAAESEIQRAGNAAPA